MLKKLCRPAACRAATERERLPGWQNTRSLENAVKTIDSKRQGKWEAGASHAEPELRPTTSGFAIHVFVGKDNGR